MVLTNKYKMKTNTEIGNEGEKLAVKHLITNNYKVLNKNWRYGHKEIDIIAENNEYLIIVEVKTRSSNFFDDASSVITNKKKRFLIDAAQKYTEKYNINKELRFDLIFISNNEIEHIKEAFNAFDL